MMHRYPGPRSFTGDDRHLFFGRDAEKQELFRLIVLNDLTVLFGESGSGKTSLLQAGVCPELEERQYKPVFIRLNNPDETPELQVCHQLKEGGYLAADLPEDRTLWEYFSRFWYVDLGEVFTPVFVFDQFEELFTLYQPEQRAAFIEQFAAIANRRPPADLPAEAAAAPNAKFIFSLRSDFLYLLDELSADIPAILRCRFQLRLLDRARAADAITRPAAMAGNYVSPVFGYSTAALDGILGALSRAGERASELVTGSHRLTTSVNPGDGVTDSHPVTTLGISSGEIAAFQLQLVCRRIEEKIIAAKSPAGFQVTPDFFKGDIGIRQMIDDFYKKVIEKVASTEREAVEKLLARGLIRNSRRIMMEASAMRDEYGVSQAALQLLHEERLLKREARKGELYYEISHDTLIKPVLERFKKIEEAEREAAATLESERKRLEEEEIREKQLARQRLEEEKEKVLLMSRQKKLARAVGYLSLSTVILLLLMGTWLVNSWQGSIKQEYKTVEFSLRNEQFDAAHSGLENLHSSPLKMWVLHKDDIPIDSLGSNVRYFSAKFKNIESLIKKADSLFFSSKGNYARALSCYRDAADSLQSYHQHNLLLKHEIGKLSWSIDSARIAERQLSVNLRIRNTIETIVREFIIHQREAEVFMEARVYGQVYRNLEIMKRLLPEYPQDMDLLRRSLELNQSPEIYVNNELRRVQLYLLRE